MGDTAVEFLGRARQVLPGGVSANARVNAALGRPFYVDRADGPFLYDLDGRRYVDTCTSNGASLIGHGHPAVKAAIQQALERGIACMHDSDAQVRLAERLVDQIPAFEMVRFTGSGTEATFYAIRVARTYTGRTKVLKFEGHFHGFNDALAFNFWPKPEEVAEHAMAVARPETDGMPPESSEQILVAPFNDVAVFQRILDDLGDQLAAVIMEPINYDSGAILPEPGFLELVRTETKRRGIVLIFDEILSGYRTGLGGAQEYLGVTPDLCTLGKAIGGGVPLSVFGGSRELMSVVSPLGRAVHTGTYNAHLIPIMAAHAFLDVAGAEGFYPRLIELHDRLYDGLRKAFAEADVPVRVQGVGARFGMYFGLDPDVPVRYYGQASRLDRSLLNAFCREMHERGIYVNPAWHHGLSSVHTDELVDQIVEAAASSARAMTR